MCRRKFLFTLVYAPFFGEYFIAPSTSAGCEYWKNKYIEINFIQVERGMFLLIEAWKKCWYFSAILLLFQRFKNLNSSQVGKVASK